MISEVCPPPHVPYNREPRKHSQGAPPHRLPPSHSRGRAPVAAHTCIQYICLTREPAKECSRDDARCRHNADGCGQSGQLTWPLTSAAVRSRAAPRQAAAASRDKHSPSDLRVAAWSSHWWRGSDAALAADAAVGKLRASSSLADVCVQATRGIRLVKCLLCSPDVRRHGYAANLVATHMLSRTRGPPGTSSMNLPSSCSLRPFSAPVPVSPICHFLIGRNVDAASVNQRHRTASVRASASSS